MRACDDLGGAAVEQKLQGPNGRLDPSVVRDAAALERNVQVGSDEDAPARDLGGLDGPRQPHGVGEPMVP
jgi:hypothetical protein